MAENKATPLEQLQARVEALEAQANHIPDATKMVPPPPPVATDDELRAIWDRSSDFEQALRAIYDLGIEHGQAGSQEVAELKAELERERIRLAVCGVVAKADTPESAKEARDMHPDYHSASLDDVISMVDALMAERAKQASSQEVAEPAPAAGEVGELVADLRAMATDAGLACQAGDFKILTLAADMLQRLGERVPAKGDEPAPAAGGLVPRVAEALHEQLNEAGNWELEARASILEVARWMCERGWDAMSDALVQEAGR